MFQCSECKERECKYDSDKKSMICGKCGHERVLEPKKSKCFRCGTEYDEYIWFDPSGCNHCKKSFLD